MHSESKAASEKQEKEIAKFLGGKVQAASGGTRFGGGDVHTKEFMIEAKTTAYARTCLQLKEEWFTKMKQQAFEQRKPHAALAIRFDPEGEDLYIIDRHLMKMLVEYIEKEE